ncbi:hypothetical protein D3C71_2232500 [compost metagenome]
MYNINAIMVTICKISPTMEIIPSEKTSAIVSRSETVRVINVPIGVLSKYLSLKLVI